MTVALSALAQKLAGWKHIPTARALIVVACLIAIAECAFLLGLIAGMIAAIAGWTILVWLLAIYWQRRKAQKNDGQENITPPTLKLGYRRQGDERPRLVFAVPKGSPAVKIRTVGAFVSEEIYRLYLPFQLLQTEIPEVEDSSAVECQFVAPNIKAALEAGGPMTLDSIAVEYSLVGRSETFTSRFFIFKNSDGSIVFSTERTVTSPKDLTELRERLRLLREADHNLTFAGRLIELANEASVICNDLARLNKEVVKTGHGKMQELMKHPLSTRELEEIGFAAPQMVSLVRFHGMWDNHRNRVAESGLVSLNNISWAVGSQEATYKEVLDGLNQHIKKLLEQATEIRRRYAALASGSAVSEMTS